jgi:hypothetical protein
LEKMLTLLTFEKPSWKLILVELWEGIPSRVFDVQQRYTYHWKVETLLYNETESAFFNFKTGKKFRALVIWNIMLKFLPNVKKKISFFLNRKWKKLSASLCSYSSSFEW